MMDFLLIGTYKFGALIFANSLCELFVHLFLLEVRQRAGKTYGKNCLGLEISIGKLLLVYFTRPPDLEALDVMWPLGA